MKLLPSRFTQVDFNQDDLKKALLTNDYTLAYIMTKAANYANSVVEYEYKAEDMKDQSSLFKAVLEHEKLKAQVLVLEELVHELTPVVEQPESEQS